MVYPTKSLASVGLAQACPNYNDKNTGAENMGGRGGNCPSTLEGGGAVPPTVYLLLLLQ